jgi:thiamine-monophosphate kinase
MPGELKIISEIRKRARASTDVSVGIGDDAAVIKLCGERDLIACSDLMVEGVHFRLEWTDAEMIGRKALAVTLSDVAAMGGAPRFAMMSVALAGKLSPEFIDDLIRGMFDLADSCGVSIIGGDTSSSRDSLFIDTIAIGECPRGRAITRAGAEAGNDIYVTGSLGAAALGLTLLEQGFTLNDEQNKVEKERGIAIRKQLAPEPRLEAGRLIGESSLAMAMIDISDGLSTDLWHILEESRCGAIIHAEAIPIAECVMNLGEEMMIDPLAFALHGGEEYELLFTARPENHTQVFELFKTLELQVTNIGHITQGGGLHLERNGSLESLAPSGYEHMI